jgi:hypothetical protein
LHRPVDRGVFLIDRRKGRGDRRSTGIDQGNSRPDDLTAGKPVFLATANQSH